MIVSELNDTERFDAVSDCLDAGRNNPLVDDLKMAKLFAEMSGEVMIYERTGINLIFDKVQAMLDSGHEYSDFILSVIHPTAHVTVQMAIGGYIK